MSDDAAQGEMLFNRLRKRYRHLRKWARRVGAGAFRVYDRDIPEIPLVLDLYLPAGTPPLPGGPPGRDPDRGEPALCGALYRRPYEKDPALEERWLEAMAGAASEALGLERERVFLRERKRLREGERYGRREGPAPLGGVAPMKGAGETLDTEEGGLRFRVNLTDYLDTGLFPDRRLLRARIREEARGKRALNLFAYTCAFSLCAAAGGAAEVVSVDMSARYLAWGMTNFSLNGFSGSFVRDFPSGREGPFRFVAADALRFLPAARRAGLSWDLIILDPPSFSNSAKMRGTLDIRRDYPELLDQCLALLGPGGRLYFSVNARGFRLEKDRWTGPGMADITETLRDEDFAGKKIPACYIFEK